MGKIYGVEMPEDKGKFFVVNEDSLDTAPRHIYFNLDEAVADGADYIDVFDEVGKPIHFYQLEDGKYELYNLG